VFWRKRILPHRMVGSILIAGCALFPALCPNKPKPPLSESQGCAVSKTQDRQSWLN
jgi:hypothetical protein